MATKRRRVKRRKTKRKQRGGAAPSKEGEKFKLNKNFDSYWDTVVKRWQRTRRRPVRSQKTPR